MFKIYSYPLLAISFFQSVYLVHYAPKYFARMLCKFGLVHREVRQNCGRKLNPKPLYKFYVTITHHRGERYIYKWKFVYAYFFLELKEYLLHVFSFVDDLRDEKLYPCVHFPYYSFGFVFSGEYRYPTELHIRIVRLRPLRCLKNTWPEIAYFTRFSANQNEVFVTLIDTPIEPFPELFERSYHRYVVKHYFYGGAPFSYYRCEFLHGNFFAVGHGSILPRLSYHLWNV